MQQNNINIVWFKRDLRLHDHAPLFNAAAYGPILPLYIVEPDYWALPDSSRRHWNFIHDCLGDMQREMMALGGHMIVRVGHVLDVLEDLRQKLGKITLWSHEETGNDWTFTRDKQVLAWCNAHQIEWHETPSNGVVRRLRNRDGWSAIRDKRMAEPVLPAPQHILMAADVMGEPRPSKDHPMFGAAIGQVQSGGRVEGMRVLDSFLQERAHKYMLTISKPGISARHCSRLSAHIAFGTLSVREIEQATKNAWWIWPSNRMNLPDFCARTLVLFSRVWPGAVILSRNSNNSQRLNFAVCTPRLKECGSRTSGRIISTHGRPATPAIRWLMPQCAACIAMAGSRFVCAPCWCLLPAIISGWTGAKQRPIWHVFLPITNRASTFHNSRCNPA